MKVFMVFLLACLIFITGFFLNSIQDAILFAISFLILFGLHEFGEYLKSKLDILFFDFTSDASILLIKYGEKLKKITIVLFLGTTGYSVYSIGMAIMKMDFMYLMSMKAAIGYIPTFPFKLCIAIFVAYYLLLAFLVLIIFVKSFCIRLSLVYAPATPSNKKIIDELDSKMARYLIFNK